MNNSKTGFFTIKKTVVAVAVVSAIIRALAAFLIELGNDEVYYWCYAMFPSLSHFDHPPMVGYLIQTLTGNLAYDSEIFIRLGSVLIGAANTYLIYVLGRAVKDELTGLYASLLYTSSLYCSVIVGTFIMPDTPQSFFFLMSIYLLHDALLPKNSEADYEEVRHICSHALLLSGLFIGLAALSKYTSIYLWGGAGLYILLYKRSMLKNPYLYISVLISLAVMSPVFIWNIQNDFISFTFHGNRVNHFAGINLISLGREIFGNIFYNNPVNFFLILVSLLAYRKRRFLKADDMRFLLSMSLPMIATFLFISIFRDTLPHWSVPAYFALIIIAASYLSDRHKDDMLRFPTVLRYANYLTLAVVVLAVLQIRTGFADPLMKIGGKYDITGRNDVTLDMYGWKELGKKFTEIRKHDIMTKKMPESAYILSHVWFEAAHQDYYVATPNRMFLKTIGSLDRTHKYAWITSKRGGINLGDDAYFIESSRYPYNGYEFGYRYFEKVELSATVPIWRNGRIVMYYRVFRFRNLVNLPPYDMREVPLSK